MKNAMIIFLLVLCSSFYTPDEHSQPVYGKYVSTDSPRTVLRVHDNGRFRLTIHHIRMANFRGRWTLKGDTLLLDFDSNEWSDMQLLRAGDHGLKSPGSDTVAFRRSAK